MAALVRRPDSLSTVTATSSAAITYPGAQRPARTRTVTSNGLDLAVYEWGPADGPVVMMAHGGFDFAGTYDVLAPMLAEHGWRCVSWDHRGHGDSSHANLYSWSADVRDAFHVLESVGQERVVLLGHSKGGALMFELADACPHRITHVVNLDGLPSKNNWPDVAERERTRMVASELTSWLDHRRSLVGRERKPGTLEELAERRGRMNPRLDPAWLRYLVPIGASESADGWRWKIDPTMRFGGFGPWRPEWSMERMPSLAVPVLGMLGLELEVMGWGTRPEDVEPYLPPGAELHALDGVGHFVHIEQPRRVADLILDFLDRRRDG